MTLLFNIDNQRIITANSRYVVADSREYLTARFVFSGDWDGCTKTVIFAGKDGTYEVLLTNDECTVPHEVLTGRFGVSVFGISGNTRITTDTAYIAVHQSGFAEGETPADPTPTVYEQLLKAIDESGQDSKAAIEKESETRAAADAELKENKADKTALNDYYTKTETDELIDAATGEMPLDSYYTKTETDGLLSDKADVSALTSEAQARAAADEALEQSKADKTAFGDYYTKAETDDLISDKADASVLNGYYTKDETDGLLSGKASASEIDTLEGAISAETQARERAIAGLQSSKADVSALQSYYTKTEADGLLDDKADTSAVSSETAARIAADEALDESKADKTELDSYYTKTEADGLLNGKADTSALGGYYTKAQTDDMLDGKADTSALGSYYTKTETDTKIAEAKSIIPKRYIVDALPTEGIDINGTYLVPAESPNENNLYDEYAYINGAWEIIGSAVEVDLSSYYTKTETDNKFCTRTAADNIVGNIETVKNNVDEALSRVNAAELRLDDIEQGDLPDLNNSINNLTSQVEGKADTSALGSYYTKDEIDYTVNTLQDGISEKIAKMQPINNPLAPSVNKTAQQVLTDSVYTNSQFSSVSQKATEALEGLEDKADIPAITTPTGTSVTLSDNTEARFGEVATLTLSLPSDTSGDYISSVAFTSGTTATSLSYPDTITMIGTDCIDGVFAPVANKRYTLIVAYDGAGLVGYVAGHEVTA